MAEATMNDNCGIYKIVNLVNGKVYVGSSKELHKRKSTHFRELRQGVHCNSHLQRAFNLYGEDSFKFEVILLCEEDLLAEEEDRWIVALKASHKQHGYNKISRIERVFSNSGNKKSDEEILRRTAKRIENGITVGEGNPRAKLTAVNVNEIRCLWLLGGNSYERIASIYGVAAQQIFNIVQEKTWTSVPFEIVDVSNINVPHRVWRCGDDSNNKKLCVSDVIKIRKMLSDGSSVKNVAEQFNVSTATIDGIRTGKTWKSAGGEVVTPRKFTKLSDADREYIIDGVGSGLSYGEIAKDIGTTADHVGSVYRRLTRRYIPGDEPVPQAA